MRELTRIAIVVGLLVGLCAALTLSGYAQEPSDSSEGPAPAATSVAVVTPLAAIPLSGNIDEQELFNFPQLGSDELVLDGPYDWAGLTFGLPAHWQLTEGTQIQLDIFAAFSTVAVAGPVVRSTQSYYPLDATLDVYFNDILLATVPIDWTGERTIVIPIAARALNSTSPTGEHVLSLWLNAPFECEPGIQPHVSLAVRSSSRLLLKRDIVPPPADLRRLPYPIYQRTILPRDKVVMVVPDQPTAEELRAAFSVAAGFGQMTAGDLTLTLIPVGQLKPAVQDANHLIFVGKPDAFPVLDQVPLPAAAGASHGDGVIQMAVSPWNQAKMVLVVSGDSDEAVVRAAQAVSSGTILTGEQRDLALVSDVEPQLSSGEVVPVDRTLADLGYSTEVMNSVGFNTVEFHFNVQPGQEASTDAYSDLVVNHSAFLSHERSGMSVLLNGQPIGAFGFSEESMALQTKRFGVPPSAIRQGDNVLRVEAYLIPFSICAPLNMNSLWATIQPESTLHLPLSPARTISVPFFDLRKYPDPFVLSPILLSDTAFVVASDDPAGWNVASQIAFDLGYLANQYLADLTVAFADAVPDEVRQARHLLVVGRPSTLPLIEELGGAMPVPFEAGSDVAMPQNDLRVDFGLPPGTSIGYLQLLPAPWNSNRAVLAALGSTDAGVQMAGTALISPTLRGQLDGNLAVVRDNQVVSSYMSHAARRIVVTITPSAVAAGTPQPTAVPVQSVVAKRPAWILPVLGISTLLLILLLVGVAVSYLRRTSAER